MIKLIQNNVFYITQSYINGSIKLNIRIFGIKISFELKDKKIHTQGLNNKIYIRENGILKERYKKIPGLTVDVKGQNNTIIIGSKFKFNDCAIHCFGRDNEIIIDDTKYYFTNLNINLSEKTINTRLHIKENVSIGGLDLFCWCMNSKISIGKESMLSNGIKIICGDGHIIYDNKTDEYLYNNNNKFCEIGDHVWIGMNNIICKNVKIPNNCIIGAGSVVTKSFSEENCAIAGNPAKIIKKNINWNRNEQIN